MNDEITAIENNTDAQPSKPTRLAFWANVGLCVVLTGAIFVLARQWGWTLGWTYVALVAAHFVVITFCVAYWNSVLIGRRMQFGEGTKPWDVVWLVGFTPIIIAVYVVAMRYPWLEGSPGTPGIAWLIGAALFVFGWMLLTWSMVANPFFEKTVRIQTGHRHHVIDTGPYAAIRHPGYVGFSAVLLATPLLLASAWAVLPALLAVLALVIRTALEDRTLQAELDGYAEYTARVRFRWIPGLW